MILKNKTASKRELMDKLTGKIVTIGAYKTIEIGKCLYDKNSFEIVKNPKIFKKVPEKEITNTKKRTKRKEKIKIYKEVNK